ncbi:MAG: TIGR04282 family arsenosugar biosynthesis glycosyltransferase [Agarilytica sp.]
MNQPIVAQFLKSPEFDPVKTRLRPVLNTGEAGALHRSLASHVAQRLSSVPDILLETWSSSGGRFAESLSEQVQSSHHIQCLGNLGIRLTYTMRACLSRSNSVIFVGSDCPFIDAYYISSAVEQLACHDVVVGPANDGGYVLLGVRGEYPQLFQGISWGSDQVFSQTLQSIEAQGLSYSVLGALSDIDRPEDLALLQCPGYEHLLALSE